MTPADPADLVLRDMSREDVRAVVRIEVDRHPVDAWSSTAFHEALDRPDRYVCLVTSTGPDESRDPHDRGAGVAAYGVISLAGGTADLDNLTVREDHQRQGIGRRLLAGLLEAAARRGAHEVLLEVRHDNVAAIALYAADRFVEISRRNDYYAPGLDAIIMRRSLDATHG